MKKNKFLALTMLCSAFCGIPTKAQEVKDSGLQKASGETDSNKKDRILIKNDKEISQVTTNGKKRWLPKGALTITWMIHEFLSHFKGDFGQFYHIPARLSVLRTYGRIEEFYNNKNIKKKYEKLINCLKNNIKVNSCKYKCAENLKDKFPNGYVVQHNINLNLCLSTSKKVKNLLGVDSGVWNRAYEFFPKNELEGRDISKKFTFIGKYDDKEVFIGLINMQYLANNFAIYCKEGVDYKNQIDSAEKFLFSHTCEQLNEWGKSDYSPIVALYYKKYDSIDDIAVKTPTKK